ncbi:pyridoxine biosynthesis protein [Coemansia reversa NRRL 1564]|uniref:pyridoxal 5'-phosphate synthase (glutamine hydrolyzing) n=1 Tax=Coemansia reversa (strain ATCC 12441 / NRRL 1564) TaxID=763665 RepID=A0A2G5B4D4_COERN|nr:pyridoxine biosynthesis protein [Coemansia reversa NRRL 1564]|eukprot:PIA13868.1 pyridoxine biosynthesis protein [Coemansia reversa NRRL 1564]
MSITQPNEEIANRYTIKLTLAKQLVGSMIVVVRTPDEAYLAEAAGARAVIPWQMWYSSYKSAYGAAHGPSLNTIRGIMDRVTIPVVGRIRRGHIIEAKAMEGSYVNFIEEHELLAPITTTEYIPKHKFKYPFIAPAVDLKEALLRIKEGVSMVRTTYKSEDDVDIIYTFSVVNKIFNEIKTICEMDETSLMAWAAKTTIPIDLVKMVVRLKKLPVPFFAAGAVLMPIDVAQLMSMGCDGVVVSSRIFGIPNPETRLQDITIALEKYNDSDALAGIIENTGGYGKNFAL